MSGFSARPQSPFERPPSPQGLSRPGTGASHSTALAAGTTAAQNPAAGIISKGTFTCEARCLCPAGADTVWVGERSGLLTVRCARTGRVKHTIQPSVSNYIFATCMTSTAHGEVWVGTTDGRICIFNAASMDLVAELRAPDVERSGEISCIDAEGKFIFVGAASCRVSQWHSITKEFMRSYAHSGAVTAVVAKGGVCYASDAEGFVVAWDAHTGERAGDVKCDGAATCLEHEPTTATLWCGLVDGRIAVLTLCPQLALVETVASGSKGRLNSLLAIGGKVWGAGIEKTTFVWHAGTRKLLGKTKDHTAFVFQLCKMYSMETARLWSLSNDKTVQVYDAEGFFASVVARGAASEEVTAAQAQAQQLRMQISLLERKLALEEEKVTYREVEVEKLKDEVHKQMLKIHALEHVLEQKDDAIHGTRTERSKLFDETAKLNAQIGELQAKLNASEQQQLLMRGDIAKAEEGATRARTDAQEKASSAVVAETERKAVAQDKDRLLEKVRAKEAEIDKLVKDLKIARDEAVAKSMEVQRRMKENENLGVRVRDLENQVGDREAKYRAAEEARRRLDDQLIVRDNELKQLSMQLQNFAVVRNAQQSTIAEIATEKQSAEATAQSFQDNLLLKSHEFDVVRQERESLEKQLSHEKLQVQDARNNEQRLALQNEELRRQVEKEKNTVRMLEDQYTIFQFVINSRGELISSIWGLHNHVNAAVKALRALDSGIQQLDPTKDKLTLKREWKLNVVDRSKAGFDAAADVQKRVDYIIANYLSEYEKMHLGIPTTKFAPDETRPSIVGDQLLTKLRDVTLMKQVPPPSDASKAQRLPPPSGSTLSAAHFTAAAPRSSSASGRAAHVPAGASSSFTAHGAPSATTTNFMHSVRPL